MREYNRKNAKIRFISDTDAMNEADDQYSIVQQMLTEEIEVMGYVAAHFERKHGEGKECSMQKSYGELKNLLELMEYPEAVPVYRGAVRPLSSPDEPVASEGAEFIIREAMRDDPRPLYVVFQGTLTDLASAWLMEPEIADRMTAIWIGGGEYPVGEWEFNLSQDIMAANVVFSSNLKLWQIPISSYRFVRTSMTELQARVAGCGAIGAYLFKQMLSCHMARATDTTFSEGTPESFIYLFENYPMESWCLGDQPLVSLMLNGHEAEYEVIPAPEISRDMFYIHSGKNRPIRVYKHIDGYLTMEDLFAKLKLNYGSL